MVGLRFAPGGLGSLEAGAVTGAEAETGAGAGPRVGTVLSRAAPRMGSRLSAIGVIGVSRGVPGGELGALSAAS